MADCISALPWPTFQDAGMITVLSLEREYELHTSLECEDWNEK
jgi:hypothetical protein